MRRHTKIHTGGDAFIRVHGDKTFKRVDNMEAHERQNYGLEENLKIKVNEQEFKDILSEMKTTLQ